MVQKHVQKSEAGMQTESNNTAASKAASPASMAPPGGSSIKQPVQEHYDWKQVRIMHHTLPAL